ncbi:hypothetical protein DXC31_02465 [Mediterraneibacter gnavus]|uniref:Uncharacterized protein n=1 Tax=Mediterraneibacter gnavus TaxID=33038 RepID=A0A3E4VCW2_MEDGN|nr:hypothetical protein DXC31_02465 [Mediterraneibacter gnavus]
MPGVLASWPALCGWAVWLGLIFRPCIVASLEGLLKKAFIFALYFSGIFSLVLSLLCGALFFFWLIFRLCEVEFFSPDFSA